jgi:hypothetical protein
MKKLLIVFLTFFCNPTYAADIGWETGTLNGWTVGGGSIATVKTDGWSSNGVGVAVTTGVQNFSPGGGNTWTINPYGSYMGSIQPGTGSTTFDSATVGLGLTSVENTAIKNYLSYQASNGGGGNPTPTNASWIKQRVTLQAGTTYSIAWNYLSTDYTPWNDGSMITLTHATNAGITPTLNNKQQRYGLLGFTNPGTGEYATGSYSSTGWQVAVFTVPETGDYDLGFTAFNLGDQSLSPILFVDQVQGDTTLNGTTFTPVAPNPGSTAPPPPAPEPSLCCGGSADPFTADTTKTSQVQEFVTRGSTDNRVFVEQIGNSNTINIKQSGGHNNYVNYYSVGSNNNININQQANTDNQTNYVDLSVTGSSNAVNITQQATTTNSFNKVVFVSITDNINSLTIQQKDGGNHYADISLSGGNKNVDIVQQGNGNHMAKIELSGLATDLSLTQSSDIQQSYSIQFNCATAGGCAAISVTQGQ